MSSDAEAFIDILHDYQRPVYFVGDDDFVTLPGADCDDFALLPGPVVRDTLPAPKFHSTQPDLETPSPEIDLPDSARDITISAWLHVPDGKAVTLLSNEGMGSNAFRLGIGSTSVLGESAAIVLGISPQPLPEHFLFFAQSSSPSGHFLSTICPSSVSTITHNGIEWQHVSFASVFGLWGAYADGAFRAFGVPWALNRPFGTHQITTENPLIADALVAGHIGDVAVYPDILAPNLVLQLAANNPFSTPEPSSLATSLVGMALAGCLLQRRTNRRSTTSR